MLTNDIKVAIKKSVLCWLATCSGDGLPNVSPKEIFSYSDGGQLLIANIASPHSVKNIRSNPNVCVSLIDIFIQKGYKIKGVAEIIEKQDDRYAALSQPLIAMTGNLFPLLSIIAVDIQSVSNIIAPSYFLFPDETKEEDQIKSAMATYGVQPIQNTDD